MGGWASGWACWAVGHTLTRVSPAPTCHAQVGLGPGSPWTVLGEGRYSRVALATNTTALKLPSECAVGQEVASGAGCAVPLLFLLSYPKGSKASRRHTFPPHQRSLPHPKTNAGKLLLSMLLRGRLINNFGAIDAPTGLRYKCTIKQMATTTLTCNVSRPRCCCRN